MSSSFCVSFQAVFKCHRKKFLLRGFEYLLKRKNNKAYNSGYATLLLLGIGLYYIIFCFVIMYLIRHNTHQLRSAKLPSRGSFSADYKTLNHCHRQDPAWFKQTKPYQGGGLQRYIRWHKVLNKSVLKNFLQTPVFNLVQLTLHKILKILHDSVLVAVDIWISAFCAWYINHDFIKFFFFLFLVVHKKRIRCWKLYFAKHLAFCFLPHNHHI